MDNYTPDGRRLSNRTYVPEKVLVEDGQPFHPLIFERHISGEFSMYKQEEYIIGICTALNPTTGKILLIWRLADLET